MDSKKTQTIVVIILVITAILGLIGAFIVYNLSTKDKAKITVENDGEYCACITAYTTPSCNDCTCTQIEGQTLESEIGEVIDGVCSLDCPTTDLDEEEVPSTINCLISEVREDICQSVSVRNANNRELLIPPININQTILISASFVPRNFNGEEEEFSKFVFVINGERTEINAQEVPSTMINDRKTYLPEIEFTNFDNIDTLTIQATAYSDREPDGSSAGRYCYKQYDLQQERGAFCSNLLAQTKVGETENDTIIDRIELNTPNLTKEDEISLEFGFAHEDLNNIRTETLPKDLLEEILVNQTLFLEYEHLYSTPSLFVDNQTFQELNSQDLDLETITLSVQLYVNGSLTDSNLCKATVALFNSQQDEEAIPETEEKEQDEEEEEEKEEEKTEDEEDAAKPMIEVAMEGPTCVNKAENEETISRTNYRVIVTNNSTTQEGIKSITNKLPQEFRYIEGTTSVNGVLIEDKIQKITLVGQSQEIIWENNWTIEPNGTLILEYGVNVTDKVSDGEVQNEVVITPVNVPEDMDKLRAEFVTTVSSECEHQEDLPDTGSLTFVSIVTGIIVLIFGILVYQGKIGAIDQLTLKLINAKAIKKNFMPIEYFEDSILEKEEKEKD